jgi:hypothetical protein
MNELGPTTAQIRDRLAKLLGLLGSDQDGEVLNAVRAIKKVLHEQGLSWSDLSEALLFGLTDDPWEAQARYFKLLDQRHERRLDAWISGERDKRERFKREHPDEHAKQQREQERKTRDRNRRTAQQVIAERLFYLREQEVEWLRSIAGKSRREQSTKNNADQRVVDQVSTATMERREWYQECQQSSGRVRLSAVARQRLRKARR